MAALAPILPVANPREQDLANVLLPPAWLEGGVWTHPFGTTRSDGTC